MNPHKLAWGFIVTFPVAQITIIGVLLGLLFEKNKGKFFQHGIVTLQVLFLTWTVITCIFAIFPERSLEQLDKFSKIMLGVFLTYLLVNSRDKLDKLIWTVFFSVGFYGIKGGYFTLRSGGGHRVWGPAGSFIADNNELACALLMIMPIGVYLYGLVSRKEARMGLVVAMGLIGVSILGSQSRGAFLGIIAVMLFWLKKATGTQRYLVILLAIFIGSIALMFMPESYWERMRTVKTYDKDASAMGRINAWWCAFRLALDRFSGAGFDYASPYTFKLYAPDPLDWHTAHSIYFQVLGDHGFPGLFLFLGILIWTWILLGRIIRRTERDETLKWANSLARMIQLSLVAFASAGAFLSLPYYDLFWQLVAIGVVLNTLLVQQGLGREPAPATRSLVNTRQRTGFVRPIKT